MAKYTITARQMMYHSQITHEFDDTLTPKKTMERFLATGVISGGGTILHARIENPSPNVWVIKGGTFGPCANWTPGIEKRVNFDPIDANDGNVFIWDGASAGGHHSINVRVWTTDVEWRSGAILRNASLCVARGRIDRIAFGEGSTIRTHGADAFIARRVTFLGNPEEVRWENNKSNFELLTDAIPHMGTYWNVDFVEYDDLAGVVPKWFEQHLSNAGTASCIRLDATTSPTPATTYRIRLGLSKQSVTVVVGEDVDPLERLEKFYQVFKS